MFDKLLRKIDQIKEEVFDEANKHVNDVTNSVRNGVGESINDKVSDVFSSIIGKATSFVGGGAEYLVQVEKIAMENRAKELGVSSRELVGLSMEEMAEKFGMTLEEYQEKITKEANQYKTNSLIDSAKELNERAEKEKTARKIQADIAKLSLEEFDKLTLQEQADKLNMSLSQLLEQRALNF